MALKVDVKFNAKAQAPLEFLITYSWVFLIVLIIITALWYFGILNPSKYLPDRCTVGPYIECKQYLLAEAEGSSVGVLRLKLKNNFGGTIKISSWELSGSNQVPYSCTLGAYTGSWEDGQTIDIEFRGCNNEDAGLIVGEKGKINIKMVYQSAQADATFSKAVEGELFTTVESTDILITEGPEELQCSVTTSCEDTFTESSTVVFRMASLEDANAEIPTLSNYDYDVCCTTISTSLSNDCTGPDEIPLHLSSDTEAHVEKNTESNFDVNVCLSANPGTVSCAYETEPCSVDETCLATISADTDAHVADCVTNPFGIYICCGLT